MRFDRSNILGNLGTVFRQHSILTPWQDDTDEQWALPQPAHRHTIASP